MTTSQELGHSLSERLNARYGKYISQYIQRLKFIYENFPESKYYPDAKKDLAEYIALAEKKPGEMGGEGFERFSILGDRLTEKGVITSGLELEIQRQNNLRDALSNPERVKDRVVSIYSNLPIKESDTLVDLPNSPKQEALIEKVGARGNIRRILDWMQGK